ncbi:HD domain-containing protein [Atopobium deltae]|uniref:HD domain protein n=1 Tax=Atopobium deltae TaxID=1393034 RepID=A0A133XQQ9_9ACTN|nr:HD domain-containing protein [Atopobium deltae]KXB33270.1 hypothetical protein HMPREF3192_01242 [Atopobium deltae]
MLSQIELSLSIAIEAHKNQVDKAGMPYVEHPKRVSAACKTDTQKVAALLHDVLEDTSTTAQDLLAQGVDAHVVEIVQLLTRPQGVSYMNYIKALAKDPDARAIKMADLTDNMNLERLENVTKEDLQRTKKYQKAYRYLESLDEG